MENLTAVQENISPMITRDKLILSHFVGFFEGEGCISPHVGKQKKGKAFTACVYMGLTNTCKPKLEQLQQTFGGHVRSMKTLPKRKQLYRLEWWGSKAVEVLKVMLTDPLFLIKRRQAELAILFRSLQKKSTGGKGYTNEEILQLQRIRDEIKFLNQRGVIAVAETKPLTLIERSDSPHSDENH